MTIVEIPINFQITISKKEHLISSGTYYSSSCASRIERSTYVDFKRTVAWFRCFIEFIIHSATNAILRARDKRFVPGKEIRRTLAYTDLIWFYRHHNGISRRTYVYILPILFDTVSQLVNFIAVDHSSMSP